MCCIAAHKASDAFAQRCDFVPVFVGVHDPFLLGRPAVFPASDRVVKLMLESHVYVTQLSL